MVGREEEGAMHKDELIYLHSVLLQLRIFFEEMGIQADFDRYDEMNISPVHIHRSKSEHKRAIFLLGEALAEAITSRSNLYERMHEIAESVSSR